MADAPRPAPPSPSPAGEEMLDALGAAAEAVAAAPGDGSPRETIVRRPDGGAAAGDPPPHVDGLREGRTSRARIALDLAGPLVLIGGACKPLGAAFDRFLSLCDARQGGRIVGITSASSDPANSARLWADDFASAGARNVELPVIMSRHDAANEALAARIREADGVFLGGGDQVKLVTVLSGTAVGCALRDAWASGAVVCGTSAGAAALTELTFAGGEIDELGTLIEMYVGPGFGLLGFHALVDTHFGARRRLHRLVVAIANHPEMLGLGIDEDTALVVHGHLAEVVGVGGVTFVDGRTLRLDDAATHGRGRQRTMSHLRVGVIGPGHRFDLRMRELVELVQADALEQGADLPMPRPSRSR